MAVVSAPIRPTHLNPQPLGWPAFTVPQDHTSLIRGKTEKAPNAGEDYFHNGFEVLLIFVIVIVGLIITTVD